MNTIAAKKSTGLGDLFGDYVPQQLEEQKNRPALPSYLEELFVKYRSTLAHCQWWIDQKAINNIFDGIILRPSDMQLFLAATMQYEDHAAHRHMTGKVLSTLLQNSYHAGYDDFTVDMSILATPLQFVGLSLEGTPEHPLSLKIHGDIGVHSGSRIKYVHYTVDGDAGALSFSNAHHSTITLGTLHFSDHPIGYDAQHCIFKSTSKATVRKLKNTLPTENKMVFINPDGQEETVRELKDG